LNIRSEEVGESFYNKMIPSTITECEEKGIVTLNKGAKCIFVKKN
jgi:arginyl-tRNA synthetase